MALLWDPDEIECQRSTPKRACGRTKGLSTILHSSIPVSRYVTSRTRVATVVLSGYFAAPSYKESVSERDYQQHAIDSSLATANAATRDPSFSSEAINHNHANCAADIHTHAPRENSLLLHHKTTSRFSGDIMCNPRPGPWLLIDLLLWFFSFFV